VALDLQALSGLQVSFLSRTGRGNWTVNASTLPAASRAELAGRLGAEGSTVTLPLAGEELSDATLDVARAAATTRLPPS
jgi:hypothetical protein